MPREKMFAEHEYMFFMQSDLCGYLLKFFIFVFWSCSVVPFFSLAFLLRRKSKKKNPRWLFTVPNWMYLSQIGHNDQGENSLHLKFAFNCDKIGIFFFSYSKSTFIYLFVFTTNTGIRWCDSWIGYIKWGLIQGFNTHHAIVTRQSNIVDVWHTGRRWWATGGRR